MHVERMKQWVDAIVNWNQGFGLATWLSYGNSGICSACAGGIATIVFESQGLYNVMGMPYVIKEDGLGICGMRAIATFFDIPLEMARFICAPDFYDDGNLTPKEIVVARINGLIAGNQDVMRDCINRFVQYNAAKTAERKARVEQTLARSMEQV